MFLQNRVKQIFRKIQNLAKKTKPTQTFWFEIRFLIKESNWLPNLTNLEPNKSVFKRTEGNDWFSLFTDGCWKDTVIMKRQKLTWT